MSFRPWAFWRRLQYGTGFLLFWALLGVGSYFIWFYAPAGCFDLVQNGSERGIDCGGACVRICTADVIPPTLIWADSFEITPGQYNSVAYVQNSNQTAGAPDLAYHLELLSESGAVLAERRGTSILPPDSIYPIFEGRVFTTIEEPVASTRLTILPTELWLPATIGRGQFRTSAINLQSADVRPRLDAKIENTELVGAEDVEVVATIFNDAGEPVQASQTFIESIASRSTRDITFTWPQSIAKTVRSCSVPTDVLLAIDVSGSMNNDQAEPPQPITAALAAASTFVSNLRAADQVGVVTFASNGTVLRQLTSDFGGVAAAVRAISIAPAEESGFTNTPAALAAAQAELNSTRHSENARRVLVLLTDGLPTTAGDEDIKAATEALAESVDVSGIEIYAIGLGAAMDQTFIRSVASTPEHAYFAPSGNDLSAIYQQITAALCESGPTKIDVIAKTQTNFAPLR